MGFWSSFGDTFFHFFKGFGKNFVKFFGFLGRSGTTIFAFAGRIGWRHFFALFYVLIILYGSLMAGWNAGNVTDGILYFGDATFGIDQEIVTVVNELRADEYFLEHGVHKWYSLIFPSIAIIGNLFIIYYFYYLLKKLLDIIPLVGDKSRNEFFNIVAFFALGTIIKLLYFIISRNTAGIIVDFTDIKVWLNSIPIIYPMYYLLSNFGFWFNSWLVPIFDLPVIKSFSNDFLRNITSNTSSNVSLNNVTQNISSNVSV